MQKEIIGGKYILLGKIGTGGMSKVFLVEDCRLKKKWAMKVMSLHQASGEEEKALLKQVMGEAKRMKELSHPNLPHVVDVFIECGFLHIVMEYIRGETLEKHLLRGEVFSEEQVVRIGCDLCEALRYLHERTPPIIYRDMKPGNVIWMPEGRIVLIDFGISREYGKQKYNDTICLGTKGYAAPEQFGGMGQTDERTDIYGLGVTLYHLVTGKNPTKPPYEIKPIRWWNPNLSKGLEQIIIRCTRQDPNLRYQDIKELLYDLKNYFQRNDFFRRKYKRHLFIFFLFLLISLSFYGIARYEDRIKIEKREKKYQGILVSRHFEEAIGYMPEKVEGYLGLLEDYRDSENKITETERCQVERLIYKNQEVLQEQEDYNNLCFQIGENLWYYYEGEMEEQFKAAYPWIVMAEKHMDLTWDKNEIIEIYMGIGYFYKEINPGVAKGKYKKSDFLTYWELLKKMKKIAEKRGHEDVTDLLRCQTYALTIRSIENYLDCFLQAGIKREVLYEVCLNMKDSLPLDSFHKLPVHLKEKYESALAYSKWEKVLEELK